MSRQVRNKTRPRALVGVAPHNVRWGDSRTKWGTTGVAHLLMSSRRASRAARVGRDGHTTPCRVVVQVGLSIRADPPSLLCSRVWKVGFVSLFFSHVASQLYSSAPYAIAGSLSWAQQCFMSVGYAGTAAHASRVSRSGQDCPLLIPPSVSRSGQDCPLLIPLC